MVYTLHGSLHAQAVHPLSTLLFLALLCPTVGAFPYHSERLWQGWGSGERFQQMEAAGAFPYCPPPEPFSGAARSYATVQVQPAFHCRI